MSRKAALAIILLLDLHASPAPARLLEAVEPHMGTLFKIRLYAHGEGEAQAAFKSAFARIAELDAMLSDYQPESEVNRMCLSAVRQSIQVSPDLFRVLSAAQKLAEDSGGAFDVTVGPVVRLWRQARTEHRLPDGDALDAALSHCGYRKLHLDAAGDRVLLDQDGMRIDLGGIAKGYAADQALEVLAQRGIRSALVAAGGDLVFGDPPPGASGWKIEIGATGKTELLHNAAVSTSGDSEQYLEVDGKRYSHIVDPTTGEALTTALTVSVLARHGVDADGLATAISVLGKARGEQLVKKYPGARCWIRN